MSTDATYVDTFTYEPLSDDHSIRVLKLHPARPLQKDDLVGELMELKLSETESEPFEALSWCWGSGQNVKPLDLRVGRQKYVMHIPPNLDNALRGLRRESEERTLWCDAVCINQKNPDERSKQVPMMNEIYGKATKTCVWLDDDTGKTKRAFEFIRNKVLKLWEFDKVCESAINSEEWIALIHLMTRSWFSRRWVIQEIALAKNATIHCGRDSLEWKDFADAVSLFVEAESATHRLSEVMKKNPNFNHIQGLFEDVHTMGATLLVEATSNLFRNRKDGPRQPLSSLEYLVSRLNVFEASEARDTIYSLLAIAKDTAPNGGIADVLRNVEPETAAKMRRVATLLGSKLTTRSYIVDYSQKEVDVYVEFVRFCIKRSNSLDILCRPWAPTPASSQRNHQANTTLLTSNGGQDRQESQRELPSWIASRARTAYDLREHEVTGLKMERRFADPLVGLPESGQRVYSASGAINVRKNRLEFRRYGVSEYDQSLFVEGFVLDEVKVVEETALRGNIPESWLQLGKWDNDAMTAPQDLWRTLVADRGPNGVNPPVFYERACTETLRLVVGMDALDTWQVVQERQCAIVAQFLRRVREVIYARCLLRTRGDRLGLVPKDTRWHGSEQNDLICILYGCSVPVVLRKFVKSAKELEEERLQNLELHDKRLKRVVEAFKKQLDRRRRGKVKRASTILEHIRQQAKSIGSTRSNKKSLAANQNSHAEPSSGLGLKSLSYFKISLLDLGISSWVLFSILEDHSFSAWILAFAMAHVTVTTIMIWRTWHGLPSMTDWATESMAKPLFEILGLIWPTIVVSQHWAHQTRTWQSTAALLLPILFLTDYAIALIRRYRSSKGSGDAAKVLQPPEPFEVYYKFIGECYIHEMMNGEAIELQNKMMELDASARKGGPDLDQRDYPQYRLQNSKVVHASDADDQNATSLFRPQVFELR